MSDEILILGLESSCDDTAAAVVGHIRGNPANVRSSIVHGQDSLHGKYGGIVPEIAARAHAERLDYCAEAALDSAATSLKAVDAIAVTAGPGLIGGLISGVAFAQGLGVGANKPLFGINHLAAHALTARMTDGIDFPYLALIASGGHCQFVAVLGADKYLRLGGTLDDAAGEAFDKTARLLGLAQPGGPSVEFTARRGNPTRFRFPRPLSGRQDSNMSFSGLKTSLIYARNSVLGADGTVAEKDVEDLCASFQAAVVDVFVEKSIFAHRQFAERTGNDVPVFAVSGGVAANRSIRHALQKVCDNRGSVFVAPPLEYCTDNAAMVAWAGIERMRFGSTGDIEIKPRPRWPLDCESRPILGSGKKGAKS